NGRVRARLACQLLCKARERLIDFALHAQDFRLLVAQTLADVALALSAQALFQLFADCHRFSLLRFRLMNNARLRLRLRRLHALLLPAARLPAATFDYG